MTRHLSAGLLMAACLAGCASLPPGSDFPKTASFALEQPEQTRLGRRSGGAARAHPGTSGFRVLSHGVDGFKARLQMIDAAERTLDLQYYIFRGDNTGNLLIDALLRAADRGVRIRLLVDDGDTERGDERIAALAEHPRMEIRVFNPFVYRGHVEPLRMAEFMLNRQLDRRMHNKLLVADNAIALLGGRNVGDAYFQFDTELQFGDYDLFGMGPIVQRLSASFDNYWNSALAIPVRALEHGKPSPEALTDYRKYLSKHRERMRAEGAAYVRRRTAGEPLAGMMGGKLAWARADLICDSPDKARPDADTRPEPPIQEPLVKAIAGLKSELLMVTPFFVPGEVGMQALAEVRRRNVRVRVMTNSLESTPEVLAHTGYARYRVPALESGTELLEVMPVLGKPPTRGGKPDLPAPKRFALHAKVFVFDRRSVYIGSMNFDQRSFHLNTEIGLLIHSSELAREAAARFETMARPSNSYRVTLRARGAGGTPRLHWRAEIGGKRVDLDSEPDRTQQRAQAGLLSLLPLDGEL